MCTQRSTASIEFCRACLLSASLFMPETAQKVKKSLGRRRGESPSSVHSEILAFSLWRESLLSKVESRADPSKQTITTKQKNDMVMKGQMKMLRYLVLALLGCWSGKASGGTTSDDLFTLDRARGRNDSPPESNARTTVQTTEATRPSVDLFSARGHTDSTRPQVMTTSSLRAERPTGVEDHGTVKATDSTQQQTLTRPSRSEGLSTVPPPGEITRQTPPDRPLIPPPGTERQTPPTRNNRPPLVVEEPVDNARQDPPLRTPLPPRTVSPPRIPAPPPPRTPAPPRLPRSPTPVRRPGRSESSSSSSSDQESQTSKTPAPAAPPNDAGDDSLTRDEFARDSIVIGDGGVVDDTLSSQQQHVCLDLQYWCTTPNPTTPSSVVTGTVPPPDTAREDRLREHAAERTAATRSPAVRGREGSTRTVNVVQRAEDRRRRNDPRALGETEKSGATTRKHFNSNVQKRDKGVPLRRLDLFRHGNDETADAVALDSVATPTRTIGVQDLRASRGQESDASSRSKASKSSKSSKSSKAGVDCVSVSTVGSKSRSGKGSKSRRLSSDGFSTGLRRSGGKMSTSGSKASKSSKARNVFDKDGCIDLDQEDPQLQQNGPDVFDFVFAEYAVSVCQFDPRTGSYQSLCVDSSELDTLAQFFNIYCGCCSEADEPGEKPDFCDSARTLARSESPSASPTESAVPTMSPTTASPSLSPSFTPCT